MKREYISNRSYKRKRRKKSGFLRILVIAAVVVILLLVLAFAGSCDKEEDSLQSFTTEPITEVATADEVTTAPYTTIPAVATQANRENCPEFEDAVARAGYSADDISGNQLVTVDAYGSGAVVNSFEKIDGVWEKSTVLSDVTGFVGEQGVSPDAGEYASYTPKGLFSLGTGFGICDDPGTSLDYIKVTSDSYWVDDVNSAYYNCYVEGTDNKDWESAEHLIEYEGYYDYCVFIEYNTNPVVPGKGSAFFLHVGNSPTAGCVAIPQESMISVLRWLDKEKSPQILIF